MQFMRGVGMIFGLIAASAFGEANGLDIRVPSDEGSHMFLKLNPDALPVGPSTFKVEKNGKSVFVAIGGDAIQDRLEIIEKRLLSMGVDEQKAGASEFAALSHARKELAKLLHRSGRSGSRSVSPNEGSKARYEGSTCGGTLVVDWNVNSYGWYSIESVAQASFSESGPPSGIAKDVYLDAGVQGNSSGLSYGDPQFLSTDGSATVASLNSYTTVLDFCPSASFVATMYASAPGCAPVAMDAYWPGYC